MDRLSRRLLIPTFIGTLAGLGLGQMTNVLQPYWPEAPHWVFALLFWSGAALTFLPLPIWLIWLAWKNRGILGRRWQMIFGFLLLFGGCVMGVLGLSFIAAGNSVASKPIASDDLAPKQDRAVNDAFSAEIRVALNSTGRSPLTMYMMQYQSSFGSTASPLPLLCYLQVTNLQSFSSSINSYKLEVQDDNGKWQTMKSIPIEEGSIYFLNQTPPPSRGTINAPPLRFPKGTYRLATPMQPNSLQNATRLSIAPIFYMELQKPIAPHGTAEGWAAFDRIDGLADIPQRHFRFTIRDSASTISVINFDNPLPGSDIDTAIALMWLTGPTIDLSGAHIKFYSEPLPVNPALKEKP